MLANEIPDEWVDKLFNCMELFYGERWTRAFKGKHVEKFYKAIWKSGLYGLSHDQIKRGLGYCKKMAETSHTMPPHVLEFHRYAKGISTPSIEYKRKNEPVGSHEIAKQYLDEIKGKLASKAYLHNYGLLHA